MIYTQQTLFGMSQNIQTCPDCRGAGKIIKENALIVMAADILLPEKIQLLFLQVLTTVKVSEYG